MQIIGVREEEAVSRLLLADNLNTSERLYWSWVKDEPQFTKTVVMDLLTTISELRERLKG